MQRLQRSVHKELNRCCSVDVTPSTEWLCNMCMMWQRRIQIISQTICMQRRLSWCGLHNLYSMTYFCRLSLSTVFGVSKRRIT